MEFTQEEKNATKLLDVELSFIFPSPILVLYISDRLLPQYLVAGNILEVQQ